MKKRRHPNHRLVKGNRTYTVEEIATLFDNHKNTVRQWIKDGLTTTDDKRPMLVHGQDLVDFLKARRLKNKRKCRPGELYCVRCRAPKLPAGGMADYCPITEKYGNLVAICPDCNSLMNRHVSLARIGEFSRKVDITFPEELSRIRECFYSPVNSDFRQER